MALLTTRLKTTSDDSVDTMAKSVSDLKASTIPVVSELEFSGSERGSERDSSCPGSIRTQQGRDEESSTSTYSTVSTEHTTGTRTIASLCADDDLRLPFLRMWGECSLGLRGNTSEDENLDIDVLGQFLVFLVDKLNQVDEDNGDDHALKNILAIIVDAFENAAHNDSFDALSASNSSENGHLATAYSMSMAILSRPGAHPVSELFSEAAAGRSKLYALFGGQGIADPVVELRQLWTEYRYILSGFILDASKTLRTLTTDRKFAEHYREAFDLMRLLKDSDSEHDSWAHLEAPISMPLVGILQLASWKVTACLLGLDPEQLCNAFQGCAGHSQGVVIASVVTMMTDWTSFQSLSLIAIEMLVSIGCRGQESSCSTLFLPQREDASTTDRVSCMLSVSGCDLLFVEQLIAESNASLRSDQRIELGLINGPSAFILSGPPDSLLAFRRLIEMVNGEAHVSNSRPHKSRQPALTTSFLPISGPFHSSHMDTQASKVVRDLEHLPLSAGELRVAVFDTFSGVDLRLNDDECLKKRLVRLVMSRQLNWPLTMESIEASHLIDFGPGSPSRCIGALTDRLSRGRRARTILFGTKSGSNTLGFGMRDEIFRPYSPTERVTLAAKYNPFVRGDDTSEWTVNTKFTRLMGKPPIMVAAMTPTTCHPDLVLAVSAAGFHVEWACGGFSTPSAMEAAARAVLQGMKEGQGLTCNVIYANPRAMKWQIALLQKLRDEGLPIHGLSIGAGVPSTNVVSSYIHDLALSHISLKPSTIEAIESVLEIARAHPAFPVILQWTGGRAGGHHSREDFHGPLLQTYANIRRQRNVVLVVGSGFGDGRGSHAFLSGYWSVAFGEAPMPVDAILLGSRIMVAREANTSLATKRLITETTGVDDVDWEATFEKVTGGVLTVISEMGEHIHKIATRGVRLWAELDKTIFSIKDPVKRLTALRSKKSHLIDRLNKDFQKVWFGQTAECAPCELEEMSYAEVTSRLLQLTYVVAMKRWIDISFKSIMHEWLAHILECAHIAEATIPCDSHEDILGLEARLAHCVPTLHDELLSFQDQAFFTALCRRPGTKPVPFILHFDDKFEYYFKKDSLWQSENLELVIDEDVQRTCILHGPVSAQFSTTYDEPVAEILRGILDGAIETHEASAVNALDDLHQTADQMAVTVIPVQVEDGNEVNILAYEDDDEAWYSHLAGIRCPHRQIAFRTLFAANGLHLSPNPIRKVFRAQPDLYVEVADESSTTRLCLYKRATRASEQDLLLAVLQVHIDGRLDLRLPAPMAAGYNAVALDLTFQAHHDRATSPLTHTTSNYADLVKTFYEQIWFGTKSAEITCRPVESLRDTTFTSTFHATEACIQHYAVNLGQNPRWRDACPTSVAAPFDFAIVAAWKALIQPLLSMGGDILSLVHLTHENTALLERSEIKSGDTIHVSSTSTKLMSNESGTVLRVRSVLSRSGTPLCQLIDEFLIRGYFADATACFDDSELEPFLLSLPTRRDTRILLSKPWFHLNDSQIDPMGMHLRFTLKVSRRPYTTTGTTPGSSLRVVGIVESCRTPTSHPVLIGRVDFTANNDKNIVLDYLVRNGTLERAYSPFDEPVPIAMAIDTITAPASNAQYAAASLDLNPIHLSPAIAAYASLDGTITHGMHTSALVRHLVEHCICRAAPNLFRVWKAEFVGVVMPTDVLRVKLQHIGMRVGRKAYSVEVQEADTGRPILIGEAEIANARAAMLFAGQGSQRKGMGAALRQTSEIARKLWDRADQFFLNTYGFKISDIVMNDPKRLEIHFGGAHGRRIRENYLAMTFSKAGTAEKARVFPDITPHSRSYTFRADGGLLNATQFAQPALVLMEVAGYEDLASRELLSKHVLFAGHSLGEYSAMMSVSKMMSLENLMNVVFYRGLIMQQAVCRDELGRSPFGMIAVNPARSSFCMSQETLETLVYSVAKATSKLVEIVNFNVKDSQYICAGDKSALVCLQQVLDSLCIVHGTETPTADAMDHAINRAVQNLSDSYSVGLRRGKITIPLQSIDVPFHSSFLRDGVAAFRVVLQDNLRKDELVPERLLGRYIPNLTARPFSLHRDYIQDVFKLTGSPVLKNMLNMMDEHRDT